MGLAVCDAKACIRLRRDKKRCGLPISDGVPSIKQAPSLPERDFEKGVDIYLSNAETKRLPILNSLIQQSA